MDRLKKALLLKSKCINRNQSPFYLVLGTEIK